MISRTKWKEMQAQKNEQAKEKPDAREEALKRLRDAMPGGYIVIGTKDAVKLDSIG